LASIGEGQNQRGKEKMGSEGGGFTAVEGGLKLGKSRARRQQAGSGLDKVEIQNLHEIGL